MANFMGFPQFSIFLKVQQTARVSHLDSPRVAVMQMLESASVLVARSRAPQRVVISVFNGAGSKGRAAYSLCYGKGLTSYRYVGGPSLQIFREHCKLTTYQYFM
ncbi:hypothetical protein NDU88_005096 [Pleurodeles waltl]|uniref:Uncharacterized protein n=1 Tax=Pleurodeles waltl TaxID=8319 RepID=A0AAV7V315_PLEWA|nr:hypothetical protein NDU88_005096 [Pleurodeles waltl]